MRCFVRNLIQFSINFRFWAYEKWLITEFIAGMARRYDDKSADKVCFKCDPRFSSKSMELKGRNISDLIADEDEESLSEMGWCSWCLLHTSQTLVQPSLITRNVYKCTHCHRRTLSCRSTYIESYLRRSQTLLMGANT